MEQTPLIELEGIVKRYEDRTVLEVERLAIEQGSLVAVVGPNGSGKTTLLKVINRLLEPDAGRYRFDGADALGTSAGLSLQRRMTYVGESPLMLTKTVTKNVAYGLRVRGVVGKESDERVRETIERVGLAHLADRRADTLSGGETKRLALARALAIRPEVLLLDEPMAYVDTASRAIIEQIIHDLHADGDTTICFTTHDLDHAYRLTATFHTLVEGRLQETTHENQLQGEVEEGPDGTVRFRCRDLVLAVETATRGPATATVDPHGIRLAPATPPPDGPNCLHGTITALAIANERVRVTIDAGVPWTVMLPPDDARTLELQLGSPIACLIHPSAIHIL